MPMVLRPAAFQTRPMNYFIARPLILLVLAALAAGAAGMPSGTSLSSEQLFELALEAQSHREYDRMLARLDDAARRGHRGAQEMLGVVLLQGPELFGPQVPRDACAAQRWLAQAAQQGSEVGRLQRDLMNRQRAQLRC